MDISQVQKSRKNIFGTPRLPVSNRAFSLVEIALALGIVSFAIVALLGLVAVSFDSNRASDEDTLIASMARQVVVELRAIPFDELAAGTNSARETFYFDHEAHRLAGPANAVYQCYPRVSPDTDFNTQGATNGPKVNLCEVLMPFLRNAAPDKPAIQTIHASIARYD